MSLGTKSFATEGVHDKVRDKVHDKAGRDWRIRRMAIRMVYFQALGIL